MSEKKIADFFQREYQKLVRYVHRLIDDTADRDAEDVVQDVMLNIFSQGDISAPFDSLSAYVYRSLKNKVIDLWRRKRSMVSLDQKIHQNEGPYLRDILADPRNDLVSEVEQREFRDLLYQAIDSLDEKDKAVLIATEFEGRSFRVLADEWGIPLGTLLARKSRAVKKIRKRLERYTHD